MPRLAIIGSGIIAQRGIRIINGNRGPFVVLAGRIQPNSRAPRRTQTGDNDISTLVTCRLLNDLENVTREGTRLGSAT